MRAGDNLPVEFIFYVGVEDELFAERDTLSGDVGVAEVGVANPFAGEGSGGSGDVVGGGDDCLPAVVRGRDFVVGVGG